MLCLSHITKSYGGIHALRGVNFEIKKGEVHALLGENGAGKSTLINILSGLVRADKGKIELDGRQVNIESVADAQALGIQTVHQELELALPLSVAENVLMGRMPCKPGGFVDFVKAREITARGLDLLHSAVNPDSRVSTLSIGDQQVVEITRAVLKNAKILVMDEPTAALPPREVERLFEVIRRLTKSGTSVIYVSHHLHEVLEIADRITVMRDGLVAAQLNRGEVDHDSLVRHILGREFIGTETKRTDFSGSIDIAMSCEKLLVPGHIHDFSFDLHHGEVLGFFGLLGAGQNIIADALFGLKPASASSCFVGGENSLPTSPREALKRGVGYIPADRKGAGLALCLSIFENLMMPNLANASRFGFLKSKKSRIECTEIMKNYAIKSDSIDGKVGMLSGGNQQKVAVAKWAKRDLKILFFDEPTRGIDVGAREEIYRFIRDFAANGGSVLVTSSDPAEISNVCDRAIVLKHGGVAAELGVSLLSEASLLAAA